MAPSSSWNCRWCCSVCVFHVLRHGLRHAVVVVGEPSPADICLRYCLDEPSPAYLGVLGAGTGLAGALDVLALHASVGVAVLAQVAVLDPEAS